MYSIGIEDPPNLGIILRSVKTANQTVAALGRTQRARDRSASSSRDTVDITATNSPLERITSESEAVGSVDIACDMGGKAANAVGTVGHDR